MQLRGSVLIGKDFVLGLSLPTACSLDVKTKYQRKYCSQVSSEAQCLPRCVTTLLTPVAGSSLSPTFSTKCNPEPRNQEEHDIVPPLLPSSGQLRHYNLDPLKQAD